MNKKQPLQKVLDSFAPLAKYKMPENNPPVFIEFDDLKLQEGMEYDDHDWYSIDRLNEGNEDTGVLYFNHKEYQVSIEYRVYKSYGIWEDAEPEVGLIHSGYNYDNSPVEVEVRQVMYDKYELLETQIDYNKIEKYIIEYSL